jgi:hypothetical protein
MFRYVPLVAALVVAGLVARTMAQPEPTTKPVEVVKAEVPSTEPISKADKFKTMHAREKVSKIQMIPGLISLGRSDAKDVSLTSKVSALLLAAELLHSTAPAAPEKGSLKDKGGTVLTSDFFPKPDELIKEAKVLAKDKEALLAMCAATEKGLVEDTKGRIPYPISGNTTLGGQAIYEAKFAVGAPAIVYASTPGGEVLSIKIMNTSVVPPQVVEERTGSTVRLEWCPRPVSNEPSNTYKIFITPLGPPGFKVQWGTN